MAQQNKRPDSVTNLFTKGMVKDFSDQFLGEGVWFHMRNGVNNAHDGQDLTVGNEPANLHCVDLPYTLIGAIPTTDGQWVVFTTDDVNSEVGVFNENICSYSKIINDPCLNFNRRHLITGAARSTYDCSYKVYFSDGNNPDRVLDINNPPFRIDRVKDGECYIETPTEELDCERLRLAPLLTVPCLRLSKSKGSGTLLNGSYQVAVAYAVNSIKVTDYLMVSNIQSIFDHTGVGGAVELSVSNTDDEFDQMEVVVISYVNGQTVAKRLGFYSTRETKIYIDTVHPETVTVPISLIPLQTPAIEKSDAIYNVGDYLLRTGIYSKSDFNYQPQANKILAKFVIVSYPENYYQQGGNNVGYMGDEQYVFFIRWIYNTGEKSASYHIPGRPPTSYDQSGPAIGDNLPGETYRWQSENTASITSLSTSTLDDGGVVVAEGLMGYYESTERYPDDRPDIWGDLCGERIRIHKFPDPTAPGVGLRASHFSGNSIQVKGVKFENITHPLDNDGNPITSIVGYEILRGSREGNKTVIAKGMLNNMREYTISGTNQRGLYQNYPYNDLRADYYLTSDKGIIDKGNPDNNRKAPLTGVSTSVFSLHSPDTNFSRPFLAGSELKVYQELIGTSYGNFEVPHKHPQFKVLTNLDSYIGKIASLFMTVNMSALSAMGGMELRMTGTEDLPLSTPLSNKNTAPNMETVGAFGTSLGNTMGMVFFAAMNVTNMLIFNLASPLVFRAMEDQLLNLIKGLIPNRQYAAQFNSHAFYNRSTRIPSGNTRRGLNDAVYVGGHLQDFGNWRINNLYRNEYVAVEINGSVPKPGTFSGTVDETRYTISENKGLFSEVIGKPTVAYYGAIKATIPSQYGQLESVKQIPISTCVHTTDQVKDKPHTSPVLFGGDTYITRYTEKNPFLFFNDWLYDQPNDFAYDYRNYINVPYPRYWIDNRKIYADFLGQASDYRHLDYRSSSALFYVNRGYFYLFCNGVRDFFVESEVNVGYRDWEDSVSKRHYDPYLYTDISAMFRSDVIKSGNYCKYDYSLSASRFYNQYISWGQVLSSDFDPAKAETCYRYFPKKVIYSLPQTQELKKDNWQSFLPNNYKNFPHRVTSIRSVGKSGALFMMEQDGPLQFVGVDTLQTDAGTKITVGDGGLFNQPMQSITNADRAYQYGNSKHKYGVIATPQGVFWVSQDSGKIFHYTGQLDELTRYGNKWWFSRYLPSELMKAFPEYEFDDNPVFGVGVQMTYDNTNEVLYVTKKDYKPVSDCLIYVPGQGFYTTLASGCEPCPAGYQFVNGKCQKLVTQAATPPVEYPLLEVSNPQWGNRGAVIFDPGYTIDGLGAHTLISSSNTYWSGKINQIAKWSGAAPVGQWIGFHFCFNVPTPGAYHIGVAGDNYINLKIDGTDIWKLDNQVNFSAYQGQFPSLTFNSYQTTGGVYPGTGVAHQLYHLFPVNFSVAGTHTITILVKDTGYPGMIAAEVYNNKKSELLSATSDSDLDIIFSTSDQTTFSTGEYKCPSGFTLVPGGLCDDPTCRGYQFVGTTLIPVDLCDPKYFENVSWTASFDLKDKTWTSLHDWHPSLILPNKNHFITSYEVCGGLKSGLWKHNERFDKFCNYYGKDYPFEIDYVVSTGQQVGTLRNVEYMLESYQYKANGQDKFHVLDHNFDQAEIYNSEQHSGRLKLKLRSKTDPTEIPQYPKVTGNFVEVLYSKEEQKYRFQIPGDLTKDRGEFSGGIVQMFRTRGNGYVYELNPLYIDYSKDPFQKKKFRHYAHHVRLIKMVSGDKKMIFKMINTKINPSQR